MKRPIKVLHIAGVEKSNYFLNNLVDFSDQEDVSFSFVTFASTNCDFLKELADRGLNVYGLDALGRSSYPRAYRELGKIMRSEAPDIVHTHLFDPSVIGLTVAKRQKRKTLLTRHHSDAIHEIASPTKRKFYLSLENYISRKSDHIIAPSQMVRDILVETEKVADEKVSIIPYGQTTERFDLITQQQTDAVRAELGMANGLSLVNVSRLFHRKGHIYLFEAFSKLISEGLKATLYLVGDGDYRQTLERQCNELNISDNVKFLGWRNDALAVVAASDIVVHPSLEDALSSAVIEAIMLEKPIVATDISGARDSLGNGKYGKIVPPADSDAFTVALKDLIENLKEYKTRAESGKLFLLDYMDAKNVAESHIEVYRRVLKGV